MCKNLIIVGASGCAREVLEWVKDINSVNQTWNILGFIDDNPSALDGKNCEYKIIGSITDWVVEPGQYFAMGIADPKTKVAIAEKLIGRGAEFASIIHPSCRISAGVTLGVGFVACPQSGLGPDCTVGDFVTLLPTVLGHDASVGDYSTICASCGINGYVKLGKRTFVGSHACVVPGRKIGDDATVGIGSVVVSNVRAGTTVFGNPAKKMDF